MFTLPLPYIPWALIQGKLDDEGKSLVELPRNYWALVERLLAARRAEYHVLQGWLGPKRFSGARGGVRGGVKGWGFRKTNWEAHASRSGQRVSGCNECGPLMCIDIIWSGLGRTRLGRLHRQGAHGRLKSNFNYELPQHTPKPYPLRLCRDISGVVKLSHNLFRMFSHDQHKSGQRVCQWPC